MDIIGTGTIFTLVSRVLRTETSCKPWSSAYLLAWYWSEDHCKQVIHSFISLLIDSVDDAVHCDLGFGKGSGRGKEEEEPLRGEGGGEGARVQAARKP